MWSAQAAVSAKFAASSPKRRLGRLLLDDEEPAGIAEGFFCASDRNPRNVTSGFSVPRKSGWCSSFGVGRQVELPVLSHRRHGVDHRVRVAAQQLAAQEQHQLLARAGILAERCGRPTALI